MADKKISQLSSATTPLAGTEVLPIVQSGSTVKVSIANVTAGRDVGTAGLTSTGNVSFDGGSFVFNDSGADKDARFEGDTNTHLLFTDASTDRVGINTSAPAAKADVVGPYTDAAPSTSSVPIIRANVGGATSLWVGARGYTNAWMQAIQDDGSNNLKTLLLQPLGGPTQVNGAFDILSDNLSFGTNGKGINDPSGNEYLKFSSAASAVNEFTVSNAATGSSPIISASGGDTNIGITLTPKGSGDVTLSTGNLVVGTAGKGIDFSANTGAAGETSSLLDWYEEGLFVPTMSASTSGTVTLAYTTLAYTRVGRLVTVTGEITVDSVASPVGDISIGNLPFANSGLSQRASRTAFLVEAGSFTGAPTGVVQGLINATSSTVDIRLVDDFVVSSLASNLQAGTFFRFCFSYMAA